MYADLLALIKCTVSKLISKWIQTIQVTPSSSERGMKTPQNRLEEMQFLGDPTMNFHMGFKALYFDFEILIRRNPKAPDKCPGSATVILPNSSQLNESLDWWFGEIKGLNNTSKTTKLANSTERHWGEISSEFIRKLCCPGHWNLGLIKQKNVIFGDPELFEQLMNLI